MQQAAVFIAGSHIVYSSDPALASSIPAEPTVDWSSPTQIQHRQVVSKPDPPSRARRAVLLPLGSSRCLSSLISICAGSGCLHRHPRRPQATAVGLPLLEPLPPSSSWTATAARLFSTAAGQIQSRSGRRCLRGSTATAPVSQAITCMASRASNHLRTTALSPKAIALPFSQPNLLLIAASPALGSCKSAGGGRRRPWGPPSAVVLDFSHAIVVYSCRCSFT